MSRTVIQEIQQAKVDRQLRDEVNEVIAKVNEIKKRHTTEYEEILFRRLLRGSLL